MMQENVQVLLQQVLAWLDQEFRQSVLQGLNDFLNEHLQEWKQLVRDMTRNGLNWALEKLNSLKSKIIKLCSQNENQLNKVFAAGAAAGGKAVIRETVTRLVTKKVISETVEKVTVAAVRETGEAVVVQTVKVAVSKTAAQSLAKSAANPVGFVGDAAQFGLELAGHKTAGKAVGASSNIASGAMTGFALGGPLGAAVGGLAGYGLWQAGEMFGSLF